MQKHTTLEDFPAVSDRDCVVSYPALEVGYETLVSIDEHGNRYESMTTPLARVRDATRMLLDRVRNRPELQPLIRRLK